MAIYLDDIRQSSGKSKMFTNCRRVKPVPPALSFKGPSCGTLDEAVIESINPRVTTGLF